MIGLVIFLILALGASGYGIYNLIRRNEVFEDLVEEQTTKLSDIRTTVLDIEAKLVSIDLKGSFESDDEVGAVFSELKETIETYKTKSNNA